MSSGTSFLSKLPLRSSSVKLRNFEISVSDSTPLFTNRNEINKDGFLTSERLLMAVVFELKLLEEQERLPFLVLIVRGSLATFWRSALFEGYAERQDLCFYWRIYWR